MADSTPGNKNDDDGLVFLSEASSGPVFDIDDGTPVSFDAAGIHAVPAIVEVDPDALDLTPGRRSIDIGAQAAAVPGRLNLDDLIRDFDQSRTKPAPVPKTDSQPANTFDLSDNTTPSTSVVADNEDALAELRAQLDDERNRVRRATADLINLRRKSEQDKERIARDTAERIIKQVLPILDDFERSVAASKETQNLEQLLGGVEAILRNFALILEKYEVVPIETVGAMFDPDYHEAMGSELVEGDDVVEDTITTELRRGYTINGRLLRAAMVRIARRAESKIAETEDPLASEPSEGEPEP